MAFHHQLIIVSSAPLSQPSDVISPGIESCNSLIIICDYLTEVNLSLISDDRAGFNLV